MSVTGWLARRKQEWTHWYYEEPPEDVDDEIAYGRGLLALNVMWIPVVSAGILSGGVDPVPGSMFLVLGLVAVAAVWDKLRDIDEDNAVYAGESR